MTDSAKRYPYDPDYAVSPAETLRECLAAEGTSVRELRNLRIPAVALKRILNGIWPITPAIAVRIEWVVGGLKAHFWLNLEANYRKQLRKVKADES